MRRRERLSLRSIWLAAARSIPLRPLAHGRWAADRAGARQSAHRGGPVSTLSVPPAASLRLQRAVKS